MKNHPLIIAHRGFSGRYPENTLAAVRAALDLGVDFVEIDVHETRDGEVIVFHDYRLKRICRVRGRVRDKTLAEIKAIESAGAHAGGSPADLPRQSAGVDRDQGSGSVQSCRRHYQATHGTRSYRLLLVDSAPEGVC